MKHKKLETNNDDNDIEWDKHLCICERKETRNSNRDKNKMKLAYSDAGYNNR